MATAKEVIAEAVKHIGYKETGNNVNMFGKWYGMNGAAWCAIFVSYCMNKAGAGSLIKGAQTAKGSAVVSGFVRHAKKHKWQQIQPAKAQAGDIVIFDFPGGYETDHVGLIRAASKGKTVLTIEGNTSSGTGSQSNGGGVYKRSRSFGVVHSIFRPPYDAEVIAPAVTVPPKAVLEAPVSPVEVPKAEQAAVTQIHLKNGSKGSEVKACQVKLGVTADGIFGNITEGAVRAFQARKGIRVTGIIDLETYERLFRK